MTEITASSLRGAHPFDFAQGMLCAEAISMSRKGDCFANNARNDDEGRDGFAEFILSEVEGLAMTNTKGDI
jgi:hypothetical protein